MKKGNISRGHFLNNGFIEMLLIIVGVLVMVSACAGHKVFQDESDLAHKRVNAGRAAHQHI